VSATLRVTVVAGLVLVSTQLLLRQVRSHEIKVEDLFDAIVLAMGTVILPGAAGMTGKALGGSALPIFNAVEDRLALIVGGAMVIGATIQGTFRLFRRAWDGQRG
jgi:hypothetical protein